jgi:DNA-binding NarL/FixJ family response regulator
MTMHPSGRLRIVLADDATLIREGIARLLTEAGLDVVGQAASAPELLACVNTEQPDVAVVDIRMPPTFTDEGLVAARQLQFRHPQVGVLVLSQYVDVAYAMKLITDKAERVGYLLKDRVADVAQFTSALRHIANGGSIVDPSLVAELLAARSRHDPLSNLTVRERDVLSLLAQGRTDRGIAKGLFLAPKTVEAHVRSIFRKLDLPADATENRRVHAVLTVLRARPPQE